MKRYFLLAILLPLTAMIWAQAVAKNKANKDTRHWRYELQPAVGQAQQGCVIVRVWSYSKNATVATAQAAKNAVHGIIFTGYAPSADAQRLPGRKPLIDDPDAEDKFETYFTDFFADGGLYQRYVSLIGNGVPDQVMKVGKEYKVGLIVTVMVDELRQRLETDGVLKKMDEIMEGKVPTIMVVPSDQWCKQNKFVTADGQPDYMAAVTTHPELLQAIAQVNTLFADRGFPLKNLESQLKTLKTQHAEDVTTSSKTGAEIMESPIDQLKNVAHADIWVKMGWTINSVAGGSQKTLSFVLQGLDAYSDKQVAGATGTGQPVYSSQAQLPLMLESAILGHINSFADQLITHFTDLQKNGRELVIRVRVFDDFDGDLESDYDGEELGVLIEEWIADNTVRGKFNTSVATANQMLFENVTVPMQNDRGRDLDARTWLRGLQRYLQQRYGIESKIMTQGLGAATLVIGGK